MPRVQTYGGAQVREAPVARERQKVVDAGPGIGGAVARLGQTLGNVAEAEEQRRTLVDRAQVMDLANQMDDADRQALRGENGFLMQTGKNALDAKGSVVEAFDARQQSLLDQAQGDRQQFLMRQAVAQRRATFLNQVEQHTDTQIKAYADQEYTSHISNLSVSAAQAGSDEERLPLLQAVAMGIEERATEQGWAAEQVAVAKREAFTNIHSAAIGTLVEGDDPHAAKQYLETWGNQIDPVKRNQLRTTVRDAVYEFDAFRTVNDLPDRSPATATPVDTPDGPITIHPPVAGASLSSPFGTRGGRQHRGVDLAVPVNTPVVASADGVIRWRNDPDGYGRYAVIDHGGGLETRYAHMSGANVADGTRVTAGTVIGLSGGARGAEGAGNSRGPHVHYEVRRNGAAVDPQQAMSNGVAGDASHAREPANPATLEDVYEESERLAGGDWRYQRVLQRALNEKYGRTLSIQADRERTAADAVAPYLPGGAQAAGSYAAIPASIRANLSPQQDTQIRNVFITEAEQAANGAGATNPEVMGSLQALYATNPARFAQLDLTTQFSSLSRSDREQVLGWQLKARTDPENSPRRQAVQSAWSDIEDIAGDIIPTGADATNEDRARMNGLRSYVMTAVDNYVARTGGDTPTREQVVGFAARGLREVRTTPGSFLNRSRTGLAFETGSGIETVVPNTARTQIVDSYKRRNNGRNPSDDYIAEAYQEGLSAGVFLP